MSCLSSSLLFFFFLRNWKYFSGDYDILKYKNGTSSKGTCFFGRSVFVVCSVRDTRVISAGLADLHSAASHHWAGLSAPFSNPSCLVVSIQRAPGSHSTGLLSTSSSPPALELLLPAPVYSAFLSNARLIQTNTATDYRKKHLKRKPARVSVMFLAHSGSRNVLR